MPNPTNRYFCIPITTHRYCIRPGLTAAVRPGRRECLQQSDLVVCSVCSSQTTWSYAVGLQQSGGRREYLQQSGGRRWEYLQQSGGRREYLQQTCGRREYLQQSGGRSEYLQQSGGRREYLQLTWGRMQYLQQSGGRREYLQTCGRSGHAVGEVGGRLRRTTSGAVLPRRITVPAGNRFCL